MIIANNSQQLIKERHHLKGSIALVTTMGNLHMGHLALVKQAKEEADHVIVTIYVNPLQFSVGEDLDSYPRTLKDDIKKLEKLDVDLLFTPSDSDIYPDGMENHTQVMVPDLSYLHCGAYRKGHFLGVSTIVCKLFNLTRPDVALFGNKDYQQLTIIRKMVADLAMPIKLIGLPTYREESGLAMSSRNRYLSAEEKQLAAELYNNLLSAEKLLKSGDADFRNIEKMAKANLTAKGFDVEFFSICNQDNLSPANPDEKHLVILAATKLGKPRLIDNIIVNLP